MARATAAEVVKMFGGTYPAGWDVTSVGNLCTQTDADLDALTHPNALSATDATAVYLANYVTYRKVVNGMWAASQPTTTPEPVVWDAHAKAMVQALQNEETSGYRALRHRAVS